MCGVISFELLCIYELTSSLTSHAYPLTHVVPPRDASSQPSTFILTGSVLISAGVTLYLGVRHATTVTAATTVTTATLVTTAKLLTEDWVGVRKATPAPG